MHTLPKKYQERIAHWDDERDMGNSIIITLKDGWCFEFPGQHVEGFDTLTSARGAVRNSKKCQCSECIENIMRKFKRG